MSTQPETRSERASRMLGEAAEIMLSAMRGLGERLNAAETPEAAQGLATALARVNRGLRQTLLLDAKLAKDAQAEAEVAAVASDRKARLDELKAKLRQEVRGIVLECCESLEAAEGFLAPLDARIEARVRDPDAGSFHEFAESLLFDLGFLPASRSYDFTDDEDDDEGGDDPAFDGRADRDPDPTPGPESDSS